ncbi:glycoside hydrolase domain-containing protein [Streptomyces sp. KL116D]|uniref:glycoside hydrolase domain-containing protein n=1 Tax=Streptomyces sp. KL116D TaxID=3045152 RepID=UPI003555CAD2
MGGPPRRREGPGRQLRRRADLLPVAVPVLPRAERRQRRRRRYTGWDQKVHRAKGFTHHQNWSLWDTYRTQAQLLSLLAPHESRDMALSVVQIDKDSGWLPAWG